MDRVLLFANPISGRGRGRLIAERLTAGLRDAGFDVRPFSQPAAEVPDDALDPGARAAIVIGGDGTLRSVVTRLTPAAAAPLLVVPMGTANLMGQHLGIRWDDARVVAQVVETLRHGREVRLDTASANGSLFLLIASVGLDAHVVHEMDRRRAGPISHLSYVIPTLLALAAYDYPPLRVSVDGRKVFGAAPALAFVGNIREYGTGFPMLPSASPTDGVLDVCVLPCRSRADLARIVMQAAAGEHVHGEGVVYTTGRSVRIESPRPAPVEVDGEAAGHTPLAIDLLPERLAFLVPPGQSPIG